MKKEISNWGLYPVVKANEYIFYDMQSLQNILAEKRTVIARGNGRSYGDASLGENIISTLSFNRFLEFDDINGIITCQSGVTLDEILNVIVPKGWFLPVTPGTKMITLGGAVAADIHGKNHHKDGSISNHIVELEILCGDGKLYTCSRQVNADLFQATCGGMGLTGIILSVKIKLKKIETSWIREVRIKAGDLDEILNLLSVHEKFTYSVAWIDCLKKGKHEGRSILFLGEHATENDIPENAGNRLKLHDNPVISIPYYLPSFLLNSYTMKSFNFLVYNQIIKKRRDGFIGYDPFFYPLDKVNNWNKLYGRKGFLQYQFVLPPSSGSSGLKKILSEITKKELGSFLAVLKLFGEKSNLLSFPMKGVTLALDFPINKNIFEFLDYLDEIVLDHGGRIYLAKDARMKVKVFQKGYPDLDKFIAIVGKYNPAMRFKSNLSNRLNITHE